MPLGFSSTFSDNKISLRKLRGRSFSSAKNEGFHGFGGNCFGATLPRKAGGIGEANTDVISTHQTDVEEGVHSTAFVYFLKAIFYRIFLLTRRLLKKEEEFGSIVINEKKE